MRSGHFLISCHKTCLMPATAALCVFLTPFLLTCLALTCTACRDGCYCIFSQDICGGSGGTELLCASCELGLSPQSAGKMAFPAAGEARDGLAVRGSCLGARRGEEPPFRVNGALHNLVMKELLRVEPPSVRSRASLQHCRLHRKG